MNERINQSIVCWIVEIDQTANDGTFVLTKKKKDKKCNNEILLLNNMILFFIFYKIEEIRTSSFLIWQQINTWNLDDDDDDDDQRCFDIYKKMKMIKPCRYMNQFFFVSFSCSNKIDILKSERIKKFLYGKKKL
jgi:hypothetical protein